jgi:hypothetical protein
MISSAHLIQAAQSLKIMAANEQVALRLAKSGLIPVLSRNCKDRKI